MTGDEEFDDLWDDDAEPVRDDGRARSFPAFAPDRRIGRTFAATWWGTAWIDAMERAALDRGQLSRGRRYALAGQVGPITVSPGRISAPVHDGDPDRPHDTVVRVGPLSERQWDRLLDALAAKAGHIAALLDREMPPELVNTAEDAGVRLLPGYGDLEPECECPSWDQPCRHAAALAYQTSWLLDRDPFVLLLMRGRAEAELVEELRRRNARRHIAVADAAAPVGTPAEEAWAAAPAPLPAPPAPVPGAPLALAPILAGHSAPRVDAEALGLLAADVASRARHLLAATRAELLAPEPDAWPDAVRLAASVPRSLAVERLAEASGRAAELPRAVRAWEYAGPAGVAALDAVFTPPPEVTARTTTALRAVADGDVKPWRNRWTVGRDVQLRHGPDGRWYPFRRRAGAWWPAGPPRTDPTDALLDLPPEGSDTERR
ncbi:SWIM zinc finger family protein [Micromonospora sp. NPDC005173]|uniref:SWIM zinc finger family protein n=1 Tax=Micromonospora sp. NPDC005173 TaxID=3157165 RepID=UPI0033AB24EB